jgi:hypothetical protein
MSDEGYACVQTLLKAAQARPAGSTKRMLKEKKKAAKAKATEAKSSCQGKNESRASRVDRP